MRARWAWIAAATTAAAVAAPAAGDVKAGVDAWARGDWDTAVREWRAPAAAGDADAQFNLGQAYKLGRGVPADLAQAEQWYSRAAQQGHPQAEDNYGLILFQNGKRGDAVRWLERSAARGEARTQFVLGTMLFNGDAVEKDWRRAYALMTRASQSGQVPQASATLAEMDRYIPLQDRQAAQALARQYEAGAGRLPVAPAGQAAVPTPPRPSGTPVRTAGAPVVAPPATTVPAPRPTPVARPTPAARPAAAPVAVRDGGWRIQLGAFRDAGNARGLWNDVSAKPAVAGRQPFYERTGTITKLQVGPFASSAEAARACAGLRPVTCVPVRR